MKVEAFAGNAIDAAGVFPVIMFMDSATNFYAGLDKAEPNATKGGGASYFYPNLTSGVPDFSKFKRGTIDSLKCNGTLAEWLI